MTGLDVSSRPLSASLVDFEARRAIRSDLESGFVVEAAAGTGKTTELVARIINVLAAGAGRLSRMVAVTFTEKAAGEMKLRIREELERARVRSDLEDDVQGRLDRALAELEEARIGTIHGFCSDLLHERPLEAAVDPVFEMVGDDTSNPIYERAFDAWFSEVLADPPEGVRRLLRRRRGGKDDASREVLYRAGLRLVDNRDYARPWRRPAGFERGPRVDAIWVELRALAQYLERAYDPRGDFLAKNLREIRRVIAEVEAREQLAGVARDYDGVEGQLWSLARHWTWRYSGFAKYFGDGLLRSEVVAARDAAKASLDAFLDDADADLAACLREGLGPLVAAYERLKGQAGVLDFRDLLLRARDLVRDDPNVRRELQGRFSHVFVDEFQDTDPTQAELMLLIAADDPDCHDWEQVTPRPGKLFVVGDPKQSIYRFRRADVALYQVIKQRLMQRGARLVTLRTSFRAVPALQDAVNGAFEREMSGGGSQADYVGLAPAREDGAGQPAVVALPIPRPYAKRNVSGKAIEASLPGAIGSFLEWLLGESGWTVAEGGARVPVRARHVCLLFRRFRSVGGDVTQEYVRALEARSIPHVLVGGQGFHLRDEVRAVRNALSAIEWPDDELSLFAALKGPMFGLGDDALLSWRARFGRLSYLRPGSDGDLLSPALARVAEALTLFWELHVGRNARPLADSLAELLEATRAHAAVASWATGEQALANLARLSEMARRFEARGAVSFRAFVESLVGQAARGEAQGGPMVEEGTDGVRVMTVHAAKGLEFPVVVLCDPTAPRAHRRPGLYVDNGLGLWAAPLAGCAPLDLLDNASEALRRDDEEGVRLAYVAATRARDLLVVPAVGDEPLSGWFDVLNKAVYPAARNRRRPGEAIGCPPFLGRETVLDRPPRAAAPPGSSVAPGEHRSDVGSRAVWWDPLLLTRPAPGVRGLREQWALEPSEDKRAEEAGVLALEVWKASRAAALERGSRPVLPASTVTAAAMASVEGTKHGIGAGGLVRDVVGDDGPAPRAGLVRDVVAADGPAPGGAVESVSAGDSAAPAVECRGEAVSEAQTAPQTTPIVVERVASDRARRPRGKRFGTLVHAVLAECSLDVEAAGLARVAGAQARLFEAPREEAEAATVAVLGALAHPLMRRAAAAERTLREVPVCVPGEGGVLEGVVDLAFREVGEDGKTVWTVVDFKSDVGLSAASERRYARQVGLYAKALSMITGETVLGHVLLV